MKLKKVLVTILMSVISIVVIFSVLKFWDKKTSNQKTASTPSVATQNTNVFQKPGAPEENYAPVAQTKTVSQLEESVQNKTSTAADYNLLAMSYHNSGDQSKALQTIDDGLAKYPNDKSLLLTKDLIENPNF